MKLLKQKLTFLLVCLFFVADLFSNLPEGISYTHLILKDQTSIHLLEIDPSFFDMISAKAKNLETVETIAEENQAIGAINGGFFHRNENPEGIHAGILKIENQWHGLPHKPRGAIGWSNSPYNVLFDQLEVSISDQSKFCVHPKFSDSTPWESVTYIVGGTPILIRNASMVTDFSSEKTIQSFLYNKHARTAVGLLPNGHLVFVVVDGTKYLFFTNSGMTIPELSLFMHDLGCVEALNLDGGGSSTMVLQGHVVNKPCGEKQDSNGHYVRDVSDALLIVHKQSTDLPK